MRKHLGGHRLARAAVAGEQHCQAQAACALRREAPALVDRRAVPHVVRDLAQRLRLRIRQHEVGPAGARRDALREPVEAPAGELAAAAALQFREVARLGLQPRAHLAHVVRAQVEGGAGVGQRLDGVDPVAEHVSPEPEQVLAIGPVDTMALAVAVDVDRLAQRRQHHAAGLLDEAPRAVRRGGRIADLHQQRGIAQRHLAVP